MRGLVHEGASRLDLRRYIGKLEANGLKLRDRLAELDAVPGVGERVLKSTAGEADRAGRSMDAGDVASVHGGVARASLGRGGHLFHARTDELVRWQPATV